MQVQSTGLRTVRYAPEQGAPLNCPPILHVAPHDMARPLVALLALLAAILIALPQRRSGSGATRAATSSTATCPPAGNGRHRHPRRRARRCAGACLPPWRRRRPPPRPRCHGSGPAPRSADPELEAKRKKAEAEIAAKNKAEQERIAALKLDNCARARAQITTLKSGIRLATTNAKTGEREFMDDKQRADETRRVQDVISNDCK